VGHVITDSGTRCRELYAPADELLQAQHGGAGGAGNLASGGGSSEDPFGRSRERVEEIVGWLDGTDAAVLEHAELEARLQTVGRELLCCLFQDHLDLRSSREQRLDGVADGDGVKRRAVERDHQRPLASVFGEVTVNRLAYRQRGEQNLYVADGALNVPVERASHGVRRMVAVEAAAGSFEHATGQVRERTGLTLGKRQVEELAVRAAVDFDAFYAERVSAADEQQHDPGDVLVLSADGKGIVMRPPTPPPAGPDNPSARGRAAAASRRRRQAPPTPAPAAGSTAGRSSHMQKVEGSDSVLLMGRAPG
jgi:hypothetical protein